MASETGRYWLCPQCRKHVPSRQDVCSCGFDRGRVGLKMREVTVGATRAPEEPRSKLGLVLGILAVPACGALLYLGIARWNAPAIQAEAPGTRRLRTSAPEPPTQQVPRVVYVPVPGSRTSPPPKYGDVPVPSPIDQAVDHYAPPQPVAAIPQAVPVPVAAAPVDAGPTETDLKRASGAIEFEREMQTLESKADQADIAWNRFLAGCHLQTTTVTAGAAVGGRDWFAFAYASATSTRWADACTEAGRSTPWSLRSRAACAWLRTGPTPLGSTLESAATFAAGIASIGRDGTGCAVRT
jgi:hypothetical protein